MKAVVFHDIGDIRLDDVPEPRIEAPTDAIVRLTASAICGTDLHFVRGTVSGMRKGTILGHEGVGIVEELGPDVRNLQIGDRVVIPSTIACGNCAYCRAGYFAQCDVANPNGKVTVVEFYDYRCGFCKTITPQIAELIRSDPNVRFVFKEYPIFGDVSDRAAKAMIAAKDSGKYLELHKALMAEKLG